MRAQVRHGLRSKSILQALAVPSRARYMKSAADSASTLMIGAGLRPALRNIAVVRPPLMKAYESQGFSNSCMLTCVGQAEDSDAGESTKCTSGERDVSASRSQIFAMQSPSTSPLHRGLPRLDAAMWESMAHIAGSIC